MSGFAFAFDNKTYSDVTGRNGSLSITLDPTNMPDYPYSDDPVIDKTINFFPGGYFTYILNLERKRWNLKFKLIDEPYAGTLKGIFNFNGAIRFIYDVYNVEGKLGTYSTLVTDFKSEEIFMNVWNMDVILEEVTV